MELDIQVSGLKQAEEQLLKLGAEVAEKELHRAINFALKPVADRAKAIAPTRTGKFRASIRRAKHRSMKTRKIAVKGIAATGASAAGISVISNRRKAPHAHLIEFGTEQRFAVSRKGKKLKKPASRGRMKPSKVFSGAFKMVGEREVLARFQRTLQKRIKRLTK